MAELPDWQLNAFDKTNPIRCLYETSIQASQQGRYDNVPKRMRYYGLHQLATQAAARHPTLSVVECGCWFGLSSRIIATILQTTAEFSGQFHIFDSFRGLSEFGPQDESKFVPTPQDKAEMRKVFASDAGHVANLLSGFPFVELHPGWIPTRFDDVAGQRFSFVSIDVDLYQPTLDAMKYFYPLVAPGGMMFFDDYGENTFPGARLAIDEALAEAEPPSFFFELPSGSAFLIK